ncbi:DUF2239 family protein [Ramlibacter rhizophilus]|uniref:DUF2239 family protein n=1 Tax=Ramlibacter rhizophilus TaxID=1781167 RepID=A0A4Z0BGX7_9BURK|nr:DUF2239 family protein [Ramlibacter rhizophilus]TFY98576.1 DUF2239 family protein [Ramlibacter rhizophilus]
MKSSPQPTYTAFSGMERLACGALEDVAVAAATAQEARTAAPLVFSDASGEQVELDLRGGERAVRARYAAPASTAAEPARGRGRPRLGVVAREVTLLPEQWDWLAAQPGGASVALRKLVQQARRAGGARERLRRAQERSYRVMVALAGNLPGFEEAARALFANDLAGLQARMRTWPKDVRDHVTALADPEAITGQED